MVLIRWEMSIQEWIKILWIFFDSELVTHPRRKWASLPSWIYLFTETTIKENPSLSPAWFCLFALLRINKSEQWACYPVSLKSNSFRLIVRCIVITVTCPCRGLALNPDELLSGREGDVASFGGDWTSPPVSGLQPLVLPDLPGASRDIQYCWATEDTGGATCGLSQLQDCMLSRGSCPGAPPPPSLPLPASPHLVFLTVSPQAVATLWARLLLRFYVGDRQCCSLVKVVSVPHSRALAGYITCNSKETASHMVPFHLWVEQARPHSVHNGGAMGGFQVCNTQLWPLGKSVDFSEPLFCSNETPFRIYITRRKRGSYADWNEEGLGSLTAWSPPFIVLGLQGTLGLWYSTGEPWR